MAEPCCVDNNCPFDDLDEKVTTIIKAMKVLQRWIDIHEGITDDDTKLFDSLNERVTRLENQSLQPKASKGGGT